MSGTQVTPREATPLRRPRTLRVLLVDDEVGFREMAAEHLEAAGMEVEQAGGGREALDILKRQAFDLAVLDLKMPDIDGLELLAKVKSDLPDIEILMLTAHGGVDTAVEAIRRGAHHYLLKPIKLAELQVALERAAEKSALNRMRDREQALQDFQGRRRRNEFLATGPGTKALLELAARAAVGAFPVLIEGETGTGKELIAHFVHEHSPRRTGPMVAINCGVLPENLLERELFGHVKGAFTGAVDGRAGLFEAADGGSLFLDEIGEADPAAQVALLRAIETGMFRRLGDVRERFADVRVIAATNRPLAKAVDAGTFRADLYHRLNVVDLHIPPLRERTGEIVPMAESFLARLRPSAGFSDDARTALTAHAWPGNVRELQNAIERAVYLGRFTHEDRPVVTSDMLGLSASPAPLSLDLESAERAHIIATLDKMGGDKSAAAGALGISLRHLYRKIKKYNLAV